MSVDYTNFLQDTAFLAAVNSYRVKRYSASLLVLDFSTERPLSVLTGKVVSGNMSYSASSVTRKTGSLTIVFDEDTYDITNVNNIIAINKKVSLSIGLENPFYNTEDYMKYGETLWFKQGTFIITSATSSCSTTSRSITVNLIDKMGMLNGTCGGVIPSAAVFNESLVIDSDGNSTTEYPLISEIIREVVHHFGNEIYSKIIIDDLADTGRFIVTWGGSTPVRFAANSGAFIVTNSPTAEQIENYPNQKVYGDDIGYLATDLTYPGELCCAIGSTVTSVLDEIVSTLGNYEYFYDVDGYFHFQAIKNFNTTGAVPTVSDVTGSESVFNITDGDSSDQTFQSQYLMTYSEDEFLNEFSSANLVTSVSFNPSYSNLKNDFVVWGTKSDGDVEKAVRYHLAIDSRPKYDEETSLCNKTIWCLRKIADQTISRYVVTDKDSVNDYEGLPSIGTFGTSSVGNVNYRGVYNSLTTYYFDGIGDSVQTSTTVTVYDDDGVGTDEIVYSYYALKDRGIGPYDTTGTALDNTEYWQELSQDEDEILLHSPSLNWFLPETAEAGDYVFDWREELYRRYLVSYGTSTEGSYYDEELAAEWRSIFNPCLKDLDPKYSSNDPDATGGFVNPFWSTFKDEWQDHFGQPIVNPTDGIENPVPWQGYTVDIISSPGNIGYWLDIIDTSAALGAYSVDQIGRRTVAEENSSINEVLNREVPDILFIDGTQDEETIESQKQEALDIGQSYLIMQSSYISYLSTRSSYGSCFEDVRSMLYKYLIYNSTVSLNSLPILYLDVNKVVRLNFPDLGVVGNYVINTMSFDFSTMSSMSLSLTEAVVVI